LAFPKTEKPVLQKEPGFGNPAGRWANHVTAQLAGC